MLKELSRLAKISNVKTINYLEGELEIIGIWEPERHESFRVFPDTITGFQAAIDWLTEIVSLAYCPKRSCVECGGAGEVVTAGSYSDPCYACNSEQSDYNYAMGVPSAQEQFQQERYQ